MVHTILDQLMAAQKVVITTHLRPDGDAIGSQLALGLFLEKCGKKVTLLNTDPLPRNLDWMTEYGKIEQYNLAMRQLKALLNADLIVVVDTNAYDRLGKRLAEAFQQATAPKILIDHHPHPENWFTHRWVHESASSTGELIYELITAHDADLIDPPIATALYTAIMTDTGSFRYNNVTPSVHRIIADLMERGGIGPEPIHVALFNNRTRASLRLLGRALDTIQTTLNGRLGYIVVTQAMLRDTGAELDETEGFVQYVLSIEDVDVAVILLETTVGIKLSFRSVGEVAINDWAVHFGGGGHPNAAGAFVRRGRMKKVIAEMLETAPQFLPFDQSTADADDLSGDDRALLAAFTKRIEE